MIKIREIKLNVLYLSSSLYWCKNIIITFDYNIDSLLISLSHILSYFEAVRL